jgi:hypothetical protein
MKKSRLATLIIGCVILAGVAPSALAQTKVGTTIGTFLRIEPSARGGALGNAGSALPGGIEAVFYNTGAIGLLDEAAVQYTHNLWYSDISYNYAALALPVRGVGNFFTSITSLGSGDIMVRTVDQPEGVGVNYKVSNVALSLGYGRRITSRFSAGIQGNYITERIWDTSVNALSINLGTVYRLSEGGAILGFCVSNLGTRGNFTGGGLDIQYDNDPDAFGDNSALPASQATDKYSLPGLVRLGLSLPLEVSENSSFLFLLEGLHPNNNSESANLGAEWKLQQLLSLRVGYQTLFQTDSELGLTFGFGVAGNLDDNSYQFNYAWSGHKSLEATHRFTLVIEF